MSLDVNHDEAYQLAQTQQEESNLARCYVELYNKVRKLEKDIADHRQDRRIRGLYPLHAGIGGPY